MACRIQILISRLLIDTDEEIERKWKKNAAKGLNRKTINGLARLFAQKTVNSSVGKADCWSPMWF
jgi:hypothetical protein